MTDDSSTSPTRERLLHVGVKELAMAPNAPKPQAVPASLVDSVRTYGVLQPLLVRPGADGYEVVAGFKRLAAAREAGLEEVPVRVYRAEDSALSGLYLATNVRSTAPTRRAPVPSSGELNTAGSLTGLLEEELNRRPGDLPYRAIVIVTAGILLVLWIGLIIKARFFENDSEDPVPAVTATPRPGSTPQPPGEDAETTRSLAAWRNLLGGRDAIEVRNSNGTPRIVFSEPVFSRLTTIDPAQKDRLENVVNTIYAAEPRAVLTVIGHTDDDPIRANSPYRSNDYLGELRATEVADYLRGTTDMPDANIRPISLGAEDPPFSNDTPTNKARNRTVTLEIRVPRGRENP